MGHIAGDHGKKGALWVLWLLLASTGETNAVVFMSRAGAACLARMRTSTFYLPQRNYGRGVNAHGSALARPPLFGHRIVPCVHAVVAQPQPQNRPACDCNKLPLVVAPVCTEDGDWYQNACVATCVGATLAVDNSTCSGVTCGGGIPCQRERSEGEATDAAR
jgi:hypothetical protein